MRSSAKREIADLKAVADLMTRKIDHAQTSSAVLPLQVETWEFARSRALALVKAIEQEDA